MFVGNPTDAQSSARNLTERPRRLISVIESTLSRYLLSRYLQSSDNQNSYSATASASGSQTNGTTCYGNCDTPYGYSRVPNDALNPYAQGVISQVRLQIGPTYKTVDNFLGQLANTFHATSSRFYRA
jgi:hypothetical protein